MDKCVQRGCSLLSCGSKPPIPPSLPACKIPEPDDGLEGSEIALIVIFVGCTMLAGILIVCKFKGPLREWTVSIGVRIDAILISWTPRNHTGNSTQSPPAPAGTADSGNVTNEDGMMIKETPGGGDPDSSTPLTHEAESNT